MILVDTSIWANHFNKPDQQLHSVARSGQIVTHSFVIGELAAGNLRPWQQSVAALRALPSLNVASDDEFFEFVFDQNLMGTGLSFVDLHLLTSAIYENCWLWTGDKRLAAAASALECLYDP